jgi:penicillin-binding protein 1A
MFRLTYYSLLIFVGVITLLVLVSLSVIWKFGNDLPDFRYLQSYKTKAMSRIYSNQDNIIEEYAEEKRVFIPYEAIPELIINAFIVTEDKNFFKHDGVDFKGISRAAFTNIKNLISGTRLVGASTITQQVAKNFLLTNEVSIDRKIKEALLALRIERTLSKEKILELYLNEIFLGYRSYGIVVAAQNYFDKSIEELNISEIAFLAGLPKGPNNYHPVKKYNSAINRRNYVLSRMFEEGVISKSNFSRALNEELKVAKANSRKTVKAEYFSEEVRKIIINKYGKNFLYTEGLYVLTTLDENLQLMAEDALKEGLLEYDKRQGWRGRIASIDSSNIDNNWLKNFKSLNLKTNNIMPYGVVLSFNNENITIGFLDGSKGKLDFEESSWVIDDNLDGLSLNSNFYKNNILKLGDVYVFKESKKYTSNNRVFKLNQIPKVNGGIVALDAFTGKVLALVGGYNFYNNKFNRVTQAQRQAGSAFKPFVYLAALENGLNPSSVILDSPLVIDQGPGLSEWIPKNYSGSYYGLSTLRTGLEKSRNVMTVRLANTIGIDKITEIANRYNIGDYPAQLATALGAGETNLLNLTAAYSTFVNGGRLVRPNLIETIHDRYGNIIFSRDNIKCDVCKIEFEEARIFNQGKSPIKLTDSAYAFQIAWMLNGVIKNGTGKSLRNINDYIGGKTGTTNDNKDAWFIGFSSNLVVGVYVGYDLPESLGVYETGGKVSAPIWGKFMKEALKKYPSQPFRIPENIEMVRIDATSGLLPNEKSSKILYEAFTTGTAPKTSEQIPSEKFIDLKPLDGKIY